MTATGYRELIDLVERLGRPRIAVVGDLMLDRYVFGDAERISPEAPIQVLRVAHEESRLGGAGSVVNNLARLGTDVDVFGVVGCDPEGEMVLAALQAIGASTEGVFGVEDRPTTLKVRFVGRAQHRIPQQVLRVDWEKAEDVSSAHQGRLLEAFEGTLAARRPGAVLLSDYGKGALSATLTAELIGKARELDIPVIVDPIRAAGYGKYRGATLLTPNRDEAQVASGICFTAEPELHDACGRLIDALDLGAVVVTLDKQGAYLREAGGPGRMVRTRPREVFDNAGAGDMVVAVIALAVAAGASRLDAVRLANVAAGIEVEKFGVQPVSREEIIADLLGEAHRHGDKRRKLENLLIDLSRHRGLDETVVFTNGCFDVLHAGHIAFLEAAAREGDVLVVGLNSDASVRRLKGPGRPVCREDERVRVLEALQPVDYVVVFDEDTPARLVDAIRPDVLVKGEDWRDKGVVGRETVEAAGGRVVLVPLVSGMSTTGLLERIRGGGPREGGDA